jgi:AcrR family transcriptional regulator
MSRRIPADRFGALIKAGTVMFVAHGYRRTQMQDVAEAMGVAKGTVYAVVASKDALLLACVRYADGIEPPPDPSAWPLLSPGGRELVDLVSERLGEVAELAIHRLAPTETESAAAEIELVVTDLMRRLVRHQRAIKLIDRCAPEIPEIAELWFGAGRADLVDQLREHLKARAERGQVRLTADPAHWDVVARTIVETCVLWAVHLRWDPAPTAFRTTRPGDEVARILAALFTSGLVPEASHPPEQHV